MTKTPAEPGAEFLNIDLLVFERFDRGPLLGALGGELMVLHENAIVDGRRCLVLEVTKPGLDLERTLLRLLSWAEHLPREAQRSWFAASRRVFDIGIQAGSGRGDSHWTIPCEQVAALAELRSEISVTVYGAEAATPRAPRKP